MSELVWESAGNDEPGDQNAESTHRVADGSTSAYYSLGPDGGGWAVEVCHGEQIGARRLGTHPSEVHAKHRAAEWERIVAVTDELVDLVAEHLREVWPYLLNDGIQYEVAREALTKAVALVGETEREGGVTLVMETLAAQADEVVVFIASRHTRTTHRRVLWRVTRVDAMKICGDQRTSNGRHMLCWTATDIDDTEWNRYVPDNGRYDDVLREHGVTVLCRYGMTVPTVA